MFRQIRHGLAFTAVMLIAVGCASSPPPLASNTPTVAAATPAPTPTPCTTQTALTGPAQASLPPPAGTAAVRTFLPAVAANMLSITLNKIPIPPIAGKTASIDIIEIDQASHLMYVTDRGDNGIDVFDVATACAKFVKTIDVGTGPNGVVVAKNVNKVFAGLNDSTIAVIDITPGADKVIAKLTTGGKGRVDEIDYDPKDKKIYVANSDDGIVTVVDATTNAIIKKFDGLGDGLEQPRYDT